MIKQQSRFVFFALILVACSPCKDNCVNGVCIKKYCDCDVWYAGDQCDRSQLLVYEGNYSGTFNHGAIVQSISFTLVNKANEPSYLYASGIDLRLEFTTSSRFIVPDQEFKNRTWIGEGEMLIDLISIRLTSVDSLDEQSGLIEAYRED